jgi:pyruvate-ferredoxin/flavodoxin oxidoreductase
VPADAPADELMPFHEYVAAQPADREGKQPFIYVLEKDRRLGRLLVAEEVVRLAEDRLAVWSLLLEMAGRGAGSAAAEAAALEGQLEELRAEYERKISDVKSRYPAIVARRLAEGLLRSGNGERTIGDLLQDVMRAPGLTPVVAQPAGNGSGAAAPVAPVAPRPAAATSAPTPAPSPGGTAIATEAAVALEPYIDSARCTACNECTAINKRLFAYNAQKQAYIKDPRAGTFKELVTAAERCPVRIIHPGTPLNPKEKDLDKWVERAKPFS